MNEEEKRKVQQGRVSTFAVFSLIFGWGVALAGCGTNNSQIFNASASDPVSKPANATGATGANVSGGERAAELDSDVECPSVTIRNGAATLTISKDPKNIEPAALDVRYQGSIVRTARECHVSAGVMTMKIGIEGRVITGPAGGPGTINVPLRIAVVAEGVEPKTVTSKLGRETVSVGNGSDRVAFTHIASDISFPMPQPVSDIDKYVVYIGFDPLGAQAEKKKPAVKRSRASKPKPQQS